MPPNSTSIDHSVPALPLVKRLPVQLKPRPAEAFSLLEVMIAAGIFFMAIFAILQLVSTNIRNARLLQDQQVTDIPAMVMADVIQTNKLQEGTYDYDISALYPGYQCSYDVTEVASNGFFKVECVVTKPGGGPNSQLSLSSLVYRPDSPRGGAFQ